MNEPPVLLQPRTKPDLRRVPGETELQVLRLAGLDVPPDGHGTGDLLASPGGLAGGGCAVQQSGPQQGLPHLVT